MVFPHEFFERVPVSPDLGRQDTTLSALRGLGQGTEANEWQERNEACSGV